VLRLPISKLINAFTVTNKKNTVRSGTIKNSVYFFFVASSSGTRGLGFKLGPSNKYNIKNYEFEKLPGNCTDKKKSVAGPASIYVAPGNFDAAIAST
jgi:hypothetical protein